MIFDVQAQDMRLHKGGAAVPCERIEAAHSHLIENMKLVAPQLPFTFAQSWNAQAFIEALITWLEQSMNTPYHDSQYWRPDTARVIQDETFVSDFLN